MRPPPPPPRRGVLLAPLPPGCPPLAGRRTARKTPCPLVQVPQPRFLPSRRRGEGVMPPKPHRLTSMRFAPTASCLVRAPWRRCIRLGPSTGSSHPLPSQRLVARPVLRNVRGPLTRAAAACHPCYAVSARTGRETRRHRARPTVRQARGLLRHPGRGRKCRCSEHMFAPV